MPAVALRGRRWPACLLGMGGLAADLTAIGIAVTGGASVGGLFLGMLAVVTGCVGLLWLSDGARLRFVVGLAALVSVGLATSAVVLISLVRADLLPQVQPGS
ncbi:MAG TPA: hypothetical protein VFX16_00470 [Pseudonocardiaceae bacterium]|nr:hypothetical protein [Pseudonocardiaceae bacterium]